MLIAQMSSEFVSGLIGLLLSGFGAVVFAFLGYVRHRDRRDDKRLAAESVERKVQADGCKGELQLVCDTFIGVLEAQRLREQRDEALVLVEELRGRTGRPGHGTS